MENTSGSALPFTFNMGATLTVSIVGSGSVNSDPAGIACSSGNCSHNYPHNTVVSLFPSASSDSLFSGWSGSCSDAGTCNVTMSEAKSVTATFNSLPPVRISRSTPVYFATLQEAYTGANSGERVELKEGTSTAGSLLAGRNIVITLSGGLNASYQNVTGTTTLQGTLRVKNGKVIINRVKLK